MIDMRKIDEDDKRLFSWFCVGYLIFVILSLPSKNAIWSVLLPGLFIILYAIFFLCEVAYEFLRDKFGRKRRTR